MAFQVPDCVGVVTATTGTGSYALGSALTRHRSFAEAEAANHLADGDTVPYVCRDASTPPVFETGIGTYNAGANTLSRTVRKSSDGNAAINWAGGSKDLFVGFLPSDLAFLVLANVFTAVQEIECSGARLDLDTLANDAAVRFLATGTERMRVFWSGTNGQAQLDYKSSGAVVQGRLIVGNNKLQFATSDVASGLEIDRFAGSGATALWFKQTTAPSGWTKSTADNDAALRVVSGTPGASGGSLGLSSTVTGGTALSEANLPPHTHPVGSGQDYPFIAPTGGTTPDLNTLTGGTRLWSVSSTTGSTGGGTNHTHPLALKYTDGIVCTKN